MTSVPGSYIESSGNIQFVQASDGSGTLSADCRKTDGSIVNSVLVYDVANMDGVLTALPGGSYQLTSRNIHFENRSDGVYLVADCQKVDGSWVQSALRLGDIANIDGVLTRF